MERKPYKIYIYRKAQRAVAARRFDTVVDVACGYMQAADWVICRRYIGVDFDNDRLQAGLRNGPGREAVHSRIEDMPDDIRGDLVLCLETIGVNEHAAPSLTLAYVKRLVAATSPGGMLIFNIGPRGQSQREADGLLGSQFETVNRIPYGRFRRAQWRWVAGALASVMIMWPAIAASPSRSAHLYIAEGRRAAE